MLFANTGTTARTEVNAASHPVEVLGGTVWLDLLDPSDAERSLVERATGLRVPARDDLAEIESSSRLNDENGVLSMSMPLATLDADNMPQARPMGFVLSKEHLLTVRYSELPVFAAYAAQLNSHAAAPSSVTAFLGLLEAMVDRLADILETIRGELDTISHRVFQPDGRRRTPAAADMQLRATLRAVGRAGDRLSNLRDSLLGVQRIVHFTSHRAADYVPGNERSRLVTLQQDITSLTDYDVQLSDKVQFLLDATLGFINIEQNNSIKILTVVSIVGVPPTLVASIYGMNFKWIPELQWDYGYFYALAMIVLTAVIPLIVFKRKGWI